MHSGIIAAIAMVVARYAAGILPVGDGGIRAIAVGAIVGLSAINYLGVRPGSAVQTGLTITKVLAIAALLAMLFGLGASHVPGPGGDVQVRGFLKALIAGLFAFGGWHMVTYAAEETRGGLFSARGPSASCGSAAARRTRRHFAPGGFRSRRCCLRRCAWRSC